MQIEKLDAALGATVKGLDLRDPLDAGQVEALRRALYEHQVLFFRGQPLDDEQHLAFARSFGQPNLYPLVEMLGGDQPLEFVKDGPERKPVAGAWHTDVTWLPDPPRIGLLAAQVMPEQGGDTLWASLYAIREALDPAHLRRLEGLEVLHTPGRFFMERVLGGLGDDFRQRFDARYGEGATHPLLREHEVTGRPLVYLSGGFMDRVVGLELEAGRQLLRELVALADDSSRHVRWDWQVDDLALWDERSTMHRVDASHWPAPREMRRCTVG